MIGERNSEFLEKGILKLVVSGIVAVLVFLNQNTVSADGCSEPSFASRVNYLAGTSLGNLTTGDFNGDGKLDLVVVDLGTYDAGSRTYTNSGISVLLGIGDGAFQSARRSAVGIAASFVTTGDFNEDGKLDLVLAEQGSYSYDTNSDISVLLGNGNGTFQNAVKTTVIQAPVSIATADFNGDGKLDMALANGGGNGVSLLMGNGDGTFQQAGGSNSGGNTGSDFVVSVLAGDFNGDAIQDLAVGILGNPRFGINAKISINLGVGDGSFQGSIINGTSGLDPKRLTTDDFNGDGKLDLIVCTAYPEVFTVMLGNGQGMFESSTSYPGSPAYVAVSDFNGDGKRDLAVAGYGTNYSLAILLGNGDGTFNVTTDVSSFGAIAVGDFNLDGKVDVALSGFSGGTEIGILMNTCPSAGVRLGIARSNSTVTLFWPLPYTNFVLQATTNLSSLNWQTISQQLTTNHNRCEVAVTNKQLSYFRLRKP